MSLLCVIWWVLINVFKSCINYYYHALISTNSDFLNVEKKMWNLKQILREQRDMNKKVFQAKWSKSEREEESQCLVPASFKKSSTRSVCKRTKSFGFRVTGIGWRIDSDFWPSSPTPDFQHSSSLTRLPTAKMQNWVQVTIQWRRIQLVNKLYYKVKSTNIV